MPSSLLSCTLSYYRPGLLRSIQDGETYQTQLSTPSNCLENTSGNQHWQSRRHMRSGIGLPCFLQKRHRDGEALTSTSISHFITIMSTVPSASTSQSNFASIFNAALDTYKRKTKKDLASHPLLPRLQSCTSPDAILTLLHEEIPTFRQSENGDNRLTKWVMPTVKVLLAFSTTFGQGVGLVNIRIFRREEISILISTFRHTHQ